MAKKTVQAKAAAARARLTKTEAPPEPPRVYLNSGNTLINLGTTGKTNCCYQAGKYYLYVGDSSAGKTLFGLTAAAEAAIDPQFAEYEIYHDDAENGSGFDVQTRYPALAARILPPRRNPDGSPRYSTTVEEFYDFLIARLKAGKKVIYILDSMDVLDVAADVKKYDKQAAARRKTEETGKKVEEAGSYGTAKAKANSDGLRRLMPLLKKTGSILVIITQTRDKISSMPVMGDNKTRGGGHALKFYAWIEYWLSVAKPLTVNVRGKDRLIGAMTKVRIKKNRAQGKHRTVMVPTFFSVGVDDVGGCVDFLVEEGHWKKAGGIDAREFGVKGPREKVVKAVEDGGKEGRLRKLVRQVWDDIESKCVLVRKNRYGG